MQWTAANNLLGRARGTPPDASWQKISPLPDVGPRSAPTLIVQGADDETVPPDQSRRLQEKLRRAGVVAAYIEYGGGHNWRGTTSAARVKIRDQIINFLRSKLLP
jgi:dipeptidyl aminopeptidase/acylaminoacyl peptidase